MKTLLAVVVAALVAALLWGYTTGAQPEGQRIAARTIVAGPNWYAALPADPAAATRSYLDRVPAQVRARGDEFMDGRYVALAGRLATLLVAVALIMFTGAAARMSALARRAVRQAWLQDALVAVFLFTVLFVLNLPVETYAGYVRLRQAGFSQRGYADWLGDEMLSWAVITVFFVVGIMLIMALIRRRPRSWAGWAMLVYLVLSSVYLLISPQYIEPLFNEITPLADGPEKRAILSLARANGVPASDVYVANASRQSDLLNAHVSGFAGSAQIVLDDNTIAKTPKPEFELVMAHELGHYVLAHTAKFIVFDTLVAGLGFFFVGWLAQWLIARHGRRWQVDSLGDTAAMPLFWGVWLFWGFLSLPITNSITREQEAEADIFGINASQQPLGLAEFMIRDSDAAKLEPSPFEEAFFYDHPSVRNRIVMAMRWRAEHLPQANP
jgi:Zn-dependent protease with chaperone function